MVSNQSGFQFFQTQHNSLCLDENNSRREILSEEKEKEENTWRRIIFSSDLPFQSATHSFSGLV